MIPVWAWILIGAFAFLFIALIVGFFADKWLGDLRWWLLKAASLIFLFLLTFALLIMTSEGVKMW